MYNRNNNISQNPEVSQRMSKIYAPCHSTDCWRQLLADPDMQWRDGYSAKTLAECWQNAEGFPPTVRLVLEGAFGDGAMLLGIPEHKVPLPGGGAASQTDLFVLARFTKGLIAIAVEGKVAEPFGPKVSEWGPDATPGHRRRLDALQADLGLSGRDLSDIRYQLLHRTVSALRLAHDFTAGTALMLVHSFHSESRWFDEYADFVSLFGAQARENHVTFLTRRGEVDLYAGWVKGC
jgi:hypothetical protein